MAVAIQPHAESAPESVSVVRRGIQLSDDILPVYDADGAQTGTETRTKGVISGVKLDADGHVTGQITADMTYDEYDAWDNTDAYATNILLAKNGLTAA